LLVFAAPARAAVPLPAVPFEKYTLPNGLQVILHEDHATPIVAVNVWYDVGSKNERPGRTGFAHLFEHMMFQGSKHQAEYFAPLQEAGGKLNGSTSQDRTNYWETVPANYLELALWMESDRMGFLLPAMTQEKLDKQRDVVRNERRQSYENRPYGLAFETILAAAYPPEHPYSWPTIGSMADLAKASREDVSDFFRRYYHPGNASLCIAGDFNPAEAKRLVAKYFGPIPAGPKVEKLAAQPVKLTDEKRIAMTDRVGLPRLYMVWPTVANFAAAEPELEVLADVLATGKTSRLEKVLVREKQIAQDVAVSQHSQALAGAMMIVATARPGHTLAELEAAILAEVGRLQAEPPSADEVRRAISRFESHFIRSLEPVGGFGGRADRLNYYNVNRGDPAYLTKDVERYLEVTPAGVQRVAKQYLGAGRVVLTVTPGAETKIAPDPRIPAAEERDKLAKKFTEPPLPPAAEVPEDADRKKLPAPGPAPNVALRPFQRAKLSNGMKVLVVEKHDLPTINMSLVWRGGMSSDPADKLGLVQLMTDVWPEGTQRRTAAQIADELAGVGASISIGAGWDVSTARMFSLKRHLPTALEISADVLRNPAFPEPELARERGTAISRLMQVRQEPMALAQLAVAATLYGPSHPYGQPFCGTEATLRSISRADLVACYQRLVRPEQATLIVVGDTTLAELTPQLEKAFAGWKASGADGAAEKLAEPLAAKPTRIVLVDKPGAAQSVISVCQIGAARNSPDYYALTVMNTIFGGQFSSRLNLNLREAKGFTYGARTAFDWRIRQPGPFLASASVQTAVTAPALVEFLKEFDGMVGARPIEAKELEFSRDYLTRGYPADLETPSQIVRQLETLVEYDLPDDYINTYIPRIAAVTAADVLGMAKAYLHPDRLAIVIVGDRTKIEANLRKLPAGKSLEVFQFDKDFRLQPADASPGR
jgi:zinc protease